MSLMKVSLAIGTTALLGLGMLATNIPTASATTVQPNTNIGNTTTVSAPYTDVTLTSTNLNDLYNAGVHTITAAFVSGPVPGTGNPTQAYWGGTTTKNSIAETQISNFLSDGGTIIPSFGGSTADNNAGQNLGQTTDTVAQIQAAEQTIIDQTHSNTIDYDIEGDYANTGTYGTALTKEAQSFAGLVKANPNLKVTLTVAGEDYRADGTIPANSADVINLFTANGVTPARINVMAMDYGPWAYTTYGTDMLANAEAVAQGTHDYLATLSYNAGVPDANIWNQVGIVQLIGTQDATDPTSQYQTLADDPQFSPVQATSLYSYATQNNMGEISIWSTGKDQPVASGTTWAQYVSNDQPTGAWLGRTDGSPTQFPQYAFSKAISGISA